MARRDKVVFLCTGNICRSPMAEALLRAAINAQPEGSALKGLRVASAGTSTVAGWLMSENSEAALRKVGVPVHDHAAQPLSKALLDETFALVAMDEGHLRGARAQFPNDMPARSFTLLSLVETARNKNVLDPYGAPMGVYEDVRDDIISGIPPLMKYLEKELQNEKDA